MEALLYEHHVAQKVERTDSSADEWNFVLINFFKEYIDKDVMIVYGQSRHVIKILEVDESNGKIRYQGVGLPQPTWMEVKHIDIAQVI